MDVCGWWAGSVGKRAASRAGALTIGREKCRECETKLDLEKPLPNTLILHCGYYSRLIV